MKYAGGGITHQLGPAGPSCSSGVSIPSWGAELSRLLRRLGQRSSRLRQQMRQCSRQQSHPFRRAGQLQRRHRTARQQRSVQFGLGRFLGHGASHGGVRNPVAAACPHHVGAVAQHGLAAGETNLLRRPINCVSLAIRDIRGGVRCEADPLQAGEIQPAVVFANDRIGGDGAPDVRGVGDAAGHDGIGVHQPGGRNGERRRIRRRRNVERVIQLIFNAVDAGKLRPLAHERHGAREQQQSRQTKCEQPAAARRATAPGEPAAQVEIVVAK